jgi:hypothetical protein
MPPSWRWPADGHAGQHRARVAGSSRSSCWSIGGDLVLEVLQQGQVIGQDRAGDGGLVGRDGDAGRLHQPLGHGGADDDATVGGEGLEAARARADQPGRVTELGHQQPADLGVQQAGQAAGQAREGPVDLAQQLIAL